MNVYELVKETLAQCGIVEPAPSDYVEKKPLFMTSFYEGYRKLCREKLHPWTTEEITLDAYKCFDTKTLTKRLVQILDVTQYRDYSTGTGGAKSQSYAWDLYDGNGMIVIPVAAANGKVFIEYEYMPEPLKVTYTVKGANTGAVIPVDEAITDSEATALVGKEINVFDISTALYYTYTVASATAGAAGSATITIDGSVVTPTADGDEIYIGEGWEPAINEDWHMLLTYWATYKYMTTRGANYAGLAAYWKNMFFEEYAYVTQDIGQPQTITGAYSPQIGS